MDNASALGHDRVVDRFAAILRVARLNSWSDEALSDASGVPARTIKSYRTEGKEPSLSNALSIMAVLGAPGINPILNLIQWTGSPLEQAELNLKGIIASGLRHFTVIADAAEDGVIDHTEWPACRKAADGLIEAVLPLSSAAPETGGNG